MEAWNGTFELIDPKSIQVDHQYQRQEKPTLIEAIAAMPKWEVFSVITCFTRERQLEGKKAVVYYCVDGQQRLAGVLRSASPPTTVPVVSFALEGVREEAEVFVRINEFRKSLTALEKHTGKIVAKDPAALAIERAVEKVGFTIGNQYARYTGTRTIQAVAALNRVYNLLGEEGLEQTLVQIRDSWGDDRAGISQQLIVLVGNLIEEANSKNGGYSRAAMTRKLSTTTPSLLMRKAHALQFDLGGSQQVNLRRAVKALCKL